MGVIKGIGHLWFVGYILFCYLITPYLSSLASYLDKLNINRLIFIVLSLICICSVIGVLTHSYFRPGRIMCYIAGFITLGLMIILRKIKAIYILKIFDKYSYEIYLVHPLFILISFTLMGISDYVGSNIVFTLLAIFISGFLLHALSTSILSFNGQGLFKRRYP